MVERKEEIEADFIAGEYRKKFYITAPDQEIADPRLFGVKNFQPENQFNSDLVTKDPNCIFIADSSKRQVCSGRRNEQFLQAPA